MRAAVLWIFSLVTLIAAPAGAQEPAAAAATDGRAIFDMVCAMCHSVAPPPKEAPPMSHAAAFYVRAYPDADSAAAAIAAYLRAPDAARSLLPPHAIERFGLMPAQTQLSEAQREAVARYVLTLADTAHMGGGHMGRHGPPGR